MRPGTTLLEALGPRRSPLWVFGAGHVGQALVRLLAELALFDIRWIDSRPELLPAGLPDGVTTQACAAPVDLVGAAAPATRYVVLTHDHALDYELCRSISKARRRRLVGSDRFGEQGGAFPCAAAARRHRPHGPDLPDWRLGDREQIARGHRHRRRRAAVAAGSAAAGPAVADAASTALRRRPLRMPATASCETCGQRRDDT